MFFTIFFFFFFFFFDFFIFFPQVTLFRTTPVKLSAKLTVSDQILQAYLQCTACYQVVRSVLRFH